MRRQVRIFLFVIRRVVPAVVVVDSEPPLYSLATTRLLSWCCCYSRRVRCCCQTYRTWQWQPRRKKCRLLGSE